MPLEPERKKRTFATEAVERLMSPAKCPRCGHINPNNQRGCNNCGLIFNPPLGSQFKENHGMEEITNE